MMRGKKCEVCVYPSNIVRQYLFQQASSFSQMRNLSLYQERPVRGSMVPHGIQTVIKYQKEEEIEARLTVSLPSNYLQIQTLLLVIFIALNDTYKHTTQSVSRLFVFCQSHSSNTPHRRIIAHPLKSLTREQKNANCCSTVLLWVPCFYATA